MLTVLLVLLCVTLLCVSPAFAAIPYTNLVASSDFTGVITDTTTTAVAVITILMVVVGLGMLVKVLGR